MTPTIQYTHPGEVVIAPWQTARDGTFGTSAVACLAPGVLTSFDAAISPHGNWKVVHDDQTRSGRARSDSDARPHVEDCLTWWVRELVERHRADVLEQALLHAESDREPDTAQPSPMPSPKPEAKPEAAPGPKGPSTPIWDADRLRALGSRIHRVRHVHGWSWRALAAHAAREGGPAVDATTWRSWAVGDHSPVQGDHAATADRWLSQHEPAEPTEEAPDLSSLFD